MSASKGRFRKRSFESHGSIRAVVTVPLTPELGDRLDAVASRPYRPPWWLRNHHLQTAWGPLLRRRAQLPFRLERLETPDDDFLRTHWLEGDDDAPTVLILHGLEGSVASHNVVGFAAAVRETLGWSVVVMEHRSCGGELNRARRMYHSGDTSDLELMVHELQRRGVQDLYLFGISLGGNVLGKWLGEQSEEAPEWIRGAAVLSPPFDLLLSGPVIDRAAFGLYTKRFLRTLVPKALAKADQFPGSMDAKKVAASKTFRDFDTWATAALHGFRDAEHYWDVVSCARVLDHVRVPLLLIAAEDDPFNPGTTHPRESVAGNPYLFASFTRRGGHTGWVEGAPPATRCWGEDQAVRFFEALAQG